MAIPISGILDFSKNWRPVLLRPSTTWGLATRISRRAITANALTTPEGTPPYSYIPPTPYTTTLSSTDYNSLQASAQIRLHSGITSTLAYTWSKAMTTGCDGYDSGCEIQNPYNLKMDRGPAAYDLPQIFAGSFVLPLPFGTGRRFNARTASQLCRSVVGS